MYSLTDFSGVHIFLLFLVMTSLYVISCHMVFKFEYFVEFTKSYQPALFQCCRLSGSSFTGRLQKHNDDFIMTLFMILGFEISIFCETGYKLST